MKKIAIFLLSLLMCFSLSACSSKPDSTITNFCNAMKNYDFDTMGEYLSDKIKETLENPYVDTEGTTEEMVNILKECASKMTYVVESSEVDGDTANVVVNFNYANLSPVMSDTLTEYMKQAFSLVLNDVTEEEMDALFNNIFNETYKSSEIQMIDSTLEFKCKKTDNGWKITELPNDFYDVLSANIVSMFDDITN